MKKTILNCLLAGMAVMSINGTAQVSAYSFSQAPGIYGFPNTGTLVGGTIQDDDVNPVNLPFGFTFNGTTYTTINVCSNGYMSFASLNGVEYSAISDPQTTELIAPFAQDLFLGTVIKGDLTAGSNTITNVSFVSSLNVGDSIKDFLGDFGNISPTITAIFANAIVLNTNAQNTIPGTDLFVNNGSIRHSVSGTSPNRVTEFEYKNLTRFATYNESINFKVRLYETSNKIEFAYGTIYGDSTVTFTEVGLKGSSNLDFKSRLVDANNTWASSAASATIFDNCIFSFLSMPNLGLTYTWNPVSCSNPVLSVLQSNSLVCAGQSATLSLAGASTYSWSNGASAASIVVTPANTTTYTAYGFNGSCSSTLNVVQYVQQNPTLTVAQTKSVICRGNTATLTVNGASSYTWSNGATSSLVVVSPTVSTTYTVSGANGLCVAQKTITQLVSICSGLNESGPAHSSLKAFPNPFTDVLNVENELEDMAEISLVDLLGNTVYLGSIEGQSKTSLSLSSLNAGVYVLILKQGQQQFSQKLIKN